VATSAKILEMIITDDIKWNVHVANILAKASKRLYPQKTIKTCECAISDKKVMDSSYFCR
jgi:hypothetical protein